MPVGVKTGVWTCRESRIVRIYLPPPAGVVEGAVDGDAVGADEGACSVFPPSRFSHPAAITIMSASAARTALIFFIVLSPPFLSIFVNLPAFSGETRY